MKSTERMDWLERRFAELRERVEFVEREIAEERLKRAALVEELHAWITGGESVKDTRTVVQKRDCEPLNGETK